MNDVSWKRILQRAGDGFPSAGGRREPQPQRNGRGRRLGLHTTTPRDFETDLRGALTRAAHNPPASGPATQRLQEAPYSPPPFDPRQPLVQGQAPVWRAPMAPPRRKGGARNIIAISLSIAIVGFAAHQVSLQWSNSRAGMTRSAVSPDSGDAPSRESGVLQTSFSFQPVHGKPSRLPASATAEDIPEAKVSTADAELQADIQQAERILRTANTTTGLDTAVSARGNAAQPSLSTAEKRSMMRRAMSHLRNGDFASARLFLVHLAEHGSAKAAMVLAKTYDRRFLGDFGVKGLRPDPVLARKWYEHAAELGSREATVNMAGLR